MPGSFKSAPGVLTPGAGFVAGGDLNSLNTAQERPDTWVIGDVHGCHATLSQLLESLHKSDPACHFVFVGDLVGKGPSSLEVLKTVYSLGDRAEVILGNHDLHLLAIHAQVATARAGDHLEECLQHTAIAQPKPWDWPRWLAEKPLALVVDEPSGSPWLVVHAGLHPQWSVAEVMTRAMRLSQRIRSGDWSWYRNPTDPDGVTAAYLTRVRGLKKDLSLADQWTGAPDSCPPTVTPWFQVEDRATREHATITGHWAALGLVRHQKHVSIDTGCVYGGALVALSLQSGVTRRIECLPEDRIVTD